MTEPGVAPDPRDAGSSTGNSTGNSTEGATRLRSALGRGALVATVLGVVVGGGLAALAAAVDGSEGLVGAVVGIALAVAFLAVTSVVGSALAGRDPLVLAGALMGSWLVKAVVAIVVLVVVRDAGIAAPVWVGVGILAGVVLSLTVQARLLLTARVPYVDAPSRADGVDG